MRHNPPPHQPTFTPGQPPNGCKGDVMVDRRLKSTVASGLMGHFNTVSRKVFRNFLSPFWQCDVF